MAEKDTDGQLLERLDDETREPPRYRVVLHNDDYTTMEFVQTVLESIFAKSPAESHRITMRIHTQGHGLCGVYSHEVAETKVHLVHTQARSSGFPLRASFEEE